MNYEKHFASVAFTHKHIPHALNFLLLLFFANKMEKNARKNNEQTNRQMVPRHKWNGRTTYLLQIYTYWQYIMRMRLSMLFRRYFLYIYFFFIYFPLMFTVTQATGGTEKKVMSRQFTHTYTHTHDILFTLFALCGCESCCPTMAIWNTTNWVIQNVFPQFFTCPILWISTGLVTRNFSSTNF